jgi:hypothetical protein
MTVLLFVMATIGLTNILVHGKVLDDEHLKVRSWLKRRLKRFGDMLDCYECSGWWAGLLMGLLLVSCNPLIFLPCAFAGAAMGHFYSTVAYLIESKTDFVVETFDESEHTP